MIGMDSDPFSIELSQQYAGSVLEPLAQGKVVLCFTIFDEVFNRNVLFVTCVLHPEAWDIAMCSNQIMRVKQAIALHQVARDKSREQGFIPSVN